jgi:hypothetical protein
MLYSATKQEIKALWERAFNAQYPELLDIKKAFDSVFLHKGGQWIQQMMIEQIRTK